MNNTTQDDPIADMQSEGDPNTDARVKEVRPKVIVTGASGFIGHRLCERLAESYDVIGLDRPGEPHPPAVADCVDLDLTSNDSVIKAFQKIRADHGDKIASVVHLAAYYDFSGEPSEKYDQITVRGTARLLNALKTFQVEQFIFSSSMLVHAPCLPGQRIDETWPLQPKWDYPASKVKTEQLIHRERDGMPVIIARVAGVYNDQCHSIPLSHQIQRIYERTLTSHLFPGDPSHGQSFVHLEDLVDFFLAAVAKRRQLQPETVLLVGESTTLSYQTLQWEFGKYLRNTLWKTYRIPKFVAKVGAWLQGKFPFIGDPFIKPWMIDLADDHYALDISHALRYLAWQPRRSLQSTLPLMIAALKKNPVDWYKEHHLRAPAWMKNRESKEPPKPPSPSPKNDDISMQNRMKELVESGMNR